MKYFDSKTGAVIDSVENRWDVENRLAQRYPIVAVEGVALEIIEAGREALGIEENIPGAIEALHDRPPAAESSEEALENFEREEEQRRAASLAGNLAAHGAPVEPEDDDRDAATRGAPAENSDEREERLEREREAQAADSDERREAIAEEDAVKTRDDGEDEAKPTGKSVQESQGKASAKAKAGGTSKK